MALAAIYFFNATDGEGPTLFQRVTPSDQQLADQRDRWNDLADVIKPRLRDTSGYEIRHWLQGSYKLGTQVRPVSDSEEFDIDLGMYFCWDGEDVEGHYLPAQLKKLVRTELEVYAAENDDVIDVTQPKERCERIRFEGSFHIDVPCYHLHSERDRRSLATSSDEWELSDPKAFYKWFKDSFDDATRVRARRIIVYLKAWAAIKLELDQGRPSSILLTVLATNAIKAARAALPEAEDEAFAYIANRVLEVVCGEKSVKNPVNASEDLASRMSDANWQTFKNELRTLSTIAQAALGATDDVGACTAWTLAFKHFFPLPPRDEIERKNALVPLTPEIAVVAISNDNANLIYRGRNEVGPIPKNCRITFDVLNAAAFPAGTEFYWVVRNVGAEADDGNDLGHIAGEGPHKEERSAYNGDHTMDCTARHGNRILGVRRVLVRIAAQAAPKRARSKPEWTKLRRRGRR